MTEEDKKTYRTPPERDADAILKEAKDAIEVEIQGLKRVQGHLGDSFVKAADLIFKATGRVVVTGIGKSGLVGRKIAATLASTGTPSIFLHPVEALHGDLGMVGQDDVIIALSNSGETQELNALIMVFKKRGIPVIALTGGLNSTLARLSLVVIDTGVEREACTLGLAPTASTTAALAIGDALAVVLLNMRKFNEKDFRRNHPGGSLGEILKVRVEEVMLRGDAIPAVHIGTDIPTALNEMDAKGLGAVLVLGDGGCLLGILTDGDLRRFIVKSGGLTKGSIEEIMTKRPKSIRPEAQAAEAITLMEQHLITVLPVVDREGCLAGIVHLHDLLGKGQFKFSV
ncbi:MAG: KpsF/GutQ family sugar-phosphate isomerase [Dissulfurimicrobium sp.]|uniref:KpsF/GutQ family sugar-phosphate isomerase n=1 Tax=Dissulfurimicrobium TaxID=1769732 RepID=UPI001EDC3EF5|nr:KpsF/GutQ family sugar-phosphate isomerase [Dissulfurimicrobium hydrothermale]UKL14130.1 KpsF/GutQ family sugar-phosphate isomerase [Dissulfurimicrobium hydrothermale]